MDLKHKLYDYINEFGWTEESKEQARSLFIAYCYSEMIDIDSRDPDEILSEIYWLCELDTVVEYKDFSHFMFQYLV